MKGIGIILVVFGHVINSNVDYFNININNLIYVFHMPMFFIISGYLIKYEKKQNIRQYISNKIRKLVIPYLFFSCFWYFYWYFIERRLRNQMSISVIKTFLNIFICKIDSNLLTPNIVNWFLPCLFFTLILFYFIRKIYNIYIKSIIILLLFVFGLFLCQNSIILPLCIETVCISLFFVSLGYQISKIKIDKYCRLSITIILIIIYIIAVIYNGDISMIGHAYGNPLLLVLGTLSGSGIIYIVSHMSNNIKAGKYLALLGENSLTIMMIHDPIKRIIVKIIALIIKIDDEIIRNSLFGSLSITIFVVLSMVPLVFIINKYLPSVVGKKRTN